MKINQLSTIAFLFILSSCISSQINLKGKEFSIGDKSIKVDAINFVNDSICFYTQTFYFDIPEQYRITDIKCSYTVSGDTITLKRISCPEYLEGYGCYILPSSIFINYEPMLVDTTEHLLIIGAPPKIDRMGLVNNINGEEDFLYYNGCLYYAKALSCLPKDTAGSNFQVFSEKRWKQASRKVKTLNKLLKQRRIPINDLDLALSR